MINERYADMLDLPHHVSAVHPQMSMHDRAAQFSPFAALTGFSGVLDEAARTTEAQVMPAADQAEELDRTLQYIENFGDTRIFVRVRYFVPDERKSGGSYRVCRGQVRKLDHDRGLLLLVNGPDIRIDRITELEIT